MLGMKTTRITAEEEYEKNPELKREDIRLLREWVASQPHLPMPSEEQLILFYHSCYYDMEATKSCIEVYYTIRSNTTECFSRRDVEREELKRMLQVMKYAPIPVKDPNGYQVIYHGVQQTEPNKYIYVDAVNLLSMAIEGCLMVEGTVPGYLFIFDMKGVRLGHLGRLSVHYLKKLFTYVQEGLPLRLKAIHVVNTLPIVDKILFMLKPFMKKELLSLVQFHYGDNETLYEQIPRACAPKDIGGELEDSAVLNEMFAEWIKTLKDDFDEEEKDRIDESKRLPKRGSGWGNFLFKGFL